MDVLAQASAEAPKADIDSDSSLSNKPTPAPPPESVEDDDRSSSLSDIEDGLDNETIESTISAGLKVPNEVDSEAETERIDESPNKGQNQRDIFVGSGPSPSKLAQSTSAADMERDADEASVLEALQSLQASRSNGVDNAASDAVLLSPSKVAQMTSPSLDQIGQKRKRSSGTDSNVNSESESDQPLRKRTGSVRSENNHEIADELDLEDESEEEIEQEQEEHDDIEEVNDEDKETTMAVGQKTWMKVKKVLDVIGQARAQSETIPEVSIDSPKAALGEEDVENGEEDEEGPGEADDADDAEVVARNEEEMAKRMSAMDSLSSIEKHFAVFRDKIYDDRLAQLNKELDQLHGPNPTHPDYLAMLQCIEQRRDEKQHLARKTFEYKVQALKTKSVAERSQINSQFFQYNRQLRDVYTEKVGEELYRIQRDRWGAEGSSPEYAIRFPTKRSTQITNQMAYNKEVSVLSGVAKYVGFPAAPAIEGATKAEIEDDFEKMGIASQARAAPQPQIPLLRGTFSSSTVIPKASSSAAAEEQFLEQTPWANPQHPVHQQHMQHIRQLSEQPHSENMFTTPVAQKRVVDLSAPNGSASTIPEVPSNQASSLVNTPVDGDPRSSRANPSGSMLKDIPRDEHGESAGSDRLIESRSLPSSPIDHRKSQLQTAKSEPHDAEQSGPFTVPHSSIFNGNTLAHTHSPSRNTLFSPPPKPEPGLQSVTSAPESLPEQKKPSPMSAMKPLAGPAGIAAGGGANGLGVR